MPRDTCARHTILTAALTILSAVYLLQPLFGQGTASIQGTVQAQGGGAIAGATLTYGPTAPPRGKGPAALMAPIHRVSSATDGTFSIQGLDDGVYLVCVSVKNQPYLDPCHWSATPVTFTVANGQSITKAVIQLAKGQQYQIRVNDPLQAFANASTAAGANLLMTVRSYSGAVHAAVVASSNATGRNYTITIPFDTPVNLSVMPGSFQVSDSVGAAVSSAGGQYQITAPSSGPPSTTTFTVNGIGNH
jgi:hypothetical protein